VLLAIPLSAISQTDVELAPEYCGRLSLGIDKEIFSKLHVTLEEEMRVVDNFGKLGRMQTTVGLKYKLHSNFRLGVGYALINPYNSDSSVFSAPRHRLMFDATGTVRFGDWNFSLRERLQMTHRTDDFNEYQNPRDAIMLKSRIMVKYKGLGMFEPYAFFELRHYLNAPVINATYDGTFYRTPDGYKKGDAGWFLDGFNDCYANRYRGSLGVEMQINKNNSLKAFVLADFVTDKVVDANAEGTKLKSYTRETGFVGSVGLEYIYEF